MNHALPKLVICSFTLWLVAGAFWYFTSPRLHEVIIQGEGSPTKTLIIQPLSFASPHNPINVSEVINLPSVQPTKFVLYSNATLNFLRVNNQEVRSPSSSPAFDQPCDLSPYLRAGMNRIDADVTPSSSSMFFFVNPFVGDGCRLLLLLIGCLAVIPTLGFCLEISRIRLDWVEWLIAYTAIVLRLVYFVATPFYVRAQDYIGHIGYIEHFGAHLKMPAIGTGWESFQPPLYYAMLGFPSRLLEHLGISREYLLSIWQFPSLLMSCATVGVCLWLARLLYPEPEQKFVRCCFLAIMAVSPALVFNASQINNDVPEVLLAYIWLGLLVKFWRDPQTTLWIGLSAVAALTILTKSNGLLLMVASMFTLAVLPRLSIEKKLMGAAVLAASFIILDGWYEAIRYVQSSGLVNGLVPNVAGLPAEENLTQSQSIAKSLTFNPWAVVAYPDVERTGLRRDMAPEFFFKSAFITREPDFQAHVSYLRVVLVSVLVLVPILVYGLIRNGLSRSPLGPPLLILSGVLLAGHWIFIRMVPYASSQDFRYSTLLLVPIAYFLLMGITGLPQRLRPLGWALLFIALAINCAYLLGLSLCLC